MVRWAKDGWVGTPPYFIAHTDAYHIITAPGHLFFPSLSGPVVCEMPSAARYAAVGVVGPLHHVVRDALCEGDEGIADVREQHRYRPSASVVRECSGNVVGVHAVSLEIMQIVTSTIRAIYLPCVQCGGTLHRGVLHPGVPVMWYAHIRDLSPTALAVRGGRVPNVTRLHWAQQKVMLWCRSVNSKTLRLDCISFFTAHHSKLDGRRDGCRHRMPHH